MLQHQERACSPLSSLLFFFCFTTPLPLSPILSPLTVFFLFSTLRYFSTRPCSNIFFSCFLHGVSGFIRLVQRGRKGMKRAGGMYEKVLDELDLNSSAPMLLPPRCIPLPRFVMAYDFTTSPLILQHFCHFTKPPAPTHHFTPQHFLSALILHIPFSFPSAFLSSLSLS